MNAAETLFSQVWEASRFVEYDREWSNGIGRHEKALYLVQPGNGKILASKTPGGKRLLIVGTRMLPVIVAEDRRFNEGMIYTVDADTSCRTTMNIPMAVDYIDDMVNIIGDPFKAIRNIGERIEDIISVYKKQNNRL